MTCLAGRARIGWLLPALVLLLLVGHACELPDIAGAAPSSEAGHAGHDHHHDDGGAGSSGAAHAISCEALAAIPTAAKPVASLAGHAEAAVFAPGQAAGLPIEAAVPVPPPPRRPRFLLLAILLI